MTRTDIAEYLVYLAKQSGLPDDGLTDHVDRCIDMGLAEFWTARNWSFRTEPYSLSISSESETYDLPSNFDGVRTIREQDSLEGASLKYYTKEAFDNLVAKPTTYGSTYPRIYTIYHDASAQGWKVKFFPVPETGHTMLMDIFVTVPSDVEEIPSGATAALLAIIAKYLYKIGSPERLYATRGAEEEINAAQRNDSPFKGNIDRIEDDTDTQIYVGRPWL